MVKIVIFGFAIRNWLTTLECDDYWRMFPLKAKKYNDNDEEAPLKG